MKTIILLSFFLMSFTVFVSAGSLFKPAYTGKRFPTGPYSAKEMCEKLIKQTTQADIPNWSKETTRVYKRVVEVFTHNFE